MFASHLILMTSAKTMFPHKLSLPAWALQLVQYLKNLLPDSGDTGDVVWISGLGRSLEKEMATCSSVLAWGIEWIESLVGLQRVGHIWTLKP